jgi:F-type H+-transporting ATPase subunit b
MWKRACFCLPVVAVNLLTAASTLAGESAQDESAALNPFSPSALEGDLALWTAVVFLVLVAVLWRYAWGPLSAALDRRERGIADQIAEAEAANQKAKDVLADYQRKLAEAKDEVRGILEQGRRDAEKLGRELLDKAKEEVSAEHARGVKEIETAADAAVRNLADRSAAMAVELAGKIVRAKLNPTDHARLIEQAVSGFTVSKN